MDYPPEATVPTQEYDNPKIFIAVAGVIAASVLVVGYVAFQFRREIHAFFSRLFGRKKRAKL